MNTNNRLVRFFLWCLICCVEVTAILAPIEAAAQPAVVSNAATAAINAIIQGAGTYANGSVTATAQAVINNAAGRAAPIVGSAVTGMTAARMAGLATGAIRVGTFVGIATLVIPWIAQESGIHVCPPPDFFCKTVTEYDRTTSGWSCVNITNGAGTISSCESACIQQNNTNNGVTDWASDGNVISSNGLQAQFNIWRLNSSKTRVTTSCSGSRTTAIIPTTHDAAASDTDISGSITSAVTKDPTKGKPLYDNLISDHVPNVHTLSDPVTITAPPVTFPSLVKTETITNADNTTSTKTTTTTTTVNPVQTGTTLGDSGLSLPQTTTTTISIKNNSTNVVTTSPSTTETDTASPSTPQQQFPTDYNREVTQQKIATELEAAASPTMAPQGPVVTSATSKADTDLAAQRTAVASEQESDKTKFFAWVWTPPVGSCAPNTGAVHGYSVSWDICPTVSNIRDVLGWLFGLLALVVVYGELFKKGDE